MGRDVNERAFYFINKARREGKTKTVVTSDPSVISTEIEAALKALGNQIQNSKRKQVAMFKAASVLRKSIQKRITDADRPVSRYINQKKVATYYPGNLRRSIKVLAHMKDKTHKYVGVEMRRGTPRGNFSGSKTDGYYAHIVEMRKPYFQPGALEAREEAKNIILEYLKQELRGGS